VTRRIALVGQHGATRRPDKRDTQQKRKCGVHSLAANSSANVLL